MTTKSVEEYNAKHRDWYHSNQERQRTYLKNWRRQKARENHSKGLTAAGNEFENQIKNGTGFWLVEWQKLYSNNVVKYYQLPDIVKERIPQMQRDLHPWYDTGKTLEQLATDYGVTRERIRQRYAKYGTCDPKEIKQLKTQRINEPAEYKVSLFKSVFDHTGFTSLKQLARLTDHQLLQIPSFGKQKLEIIKLVRKQNDFKIDLRTDYAKKSGSNPTADITDQDLDQLHQKFLDHFDRTVSGCWVTRSSADKYGGIYFKNTIILPHRYSYTYYNKAIPKGHQVYRKCLNFKCCNPDHLYTDGHRDHHNVISYSEFPKRKKTNLLDLLVGLFRRI